MTTTVTAPIVPSFGEEESGRKLAIICSKGNLDMAYPGLILANAALGEGVETHLFFTFWGFDMINKKTMGDLKFTLDGVKLKGSWVIVRTKGGGWSGGGDRSWLLIKHKDDWAGEVDIAEFAPLSVKSKGDFADILAKDKPDVWESHKPEGGGAAGKMLREIIEKAAALKAKKGGKAKKATSKRGRLRSSRAV